jgi:hypothetical protein
MHGFEIKRGGLRILAVGLVLLLAGACGGGKDLTAPGPGGGGNGNGGNGGGGNGGNGNGGLAGDYQLARIGFVGLPADLTFESCDPVRITGGALRINGDGTWEFAIALQDQNGQGEFDDEGTMAQNGATLSFESAAYGDSFTGKIDGAILMDYDYCPDGQSDIQLVFGR